MFNYLCNDYVVVIHLAGPNFTDPARHKIYILAVPYNSSSPPRCMDATHAQGNSQYPGMIYLDSDQLQKAIAALELHMGQLLWW